MADKKRASIVIDGFKFELIEDGQAFNGYRWMPMSPKDASSDSKLGIPASLFEIKLWEVLVEKDKQIALLREVIARNLPEVENDKAK